MTTDIIEAIDALLMQPFCSTNQAMALEMQQWRQELKAIKERLAKVSESSERLIIEESCRQIMTQVENRLATANLLHVSPQVEYAAFELASTLTSLTAANTLATIKENIHQLLSSLLQDVKTELHTIFAQERAATMTLLQEQVSHLFATIPAQTIEKSPESNPDTPPLIDTALLHWLDDRIASLAELENSQTTETSEKSDIITYGEPSAIYPEILTPEVTLPDRQDSVCPPDNFEDLFSETIDVDSNTIDDQLNAFADQISFIIPGATSGNDTPALPPIPAIPKGDIHDSWFLGIDFGTTHVQATLSNLTTGVIYPLNFGDSHEQLSAEILFSAATGGNLTVQNYKSILQLGLPYLSEQKWQPVIQWAPQQRIPLKSFLIALRQLFLRLKKLASHAQLANLPEILNHLSGVVFGHPITWADAYIFNLREIILEARLCRSPEQIIAIPQILSPLLAMLHHEQPIADGALFIDAGFATTEMLLVRGKNGTPLHADHLFYQGASPGSEKINMDIVRELMVPAIGIAIPIEDEVEFSQYLKSTPQGISLYQQAEVIKRHLILHETWQGTWERQSFSIGRHSFIHKVLHPFLQILNRNINTVLIRAGLFAENIETVYLLGGLMPLLEQWCREKFPGAQIQLGKSTAHGLAVAARFYGLLDLSHQQYSNFFLLHEICKLDWQEPMHPATILQQLQHRGININSCVHRVIGILQNNLPEGTIPQGKLIVPDPLMQTLLHSPGIFTRLANGCYHPDRGQLQLIEGYLEQLCNHIQQSITEPMVFNPLIAARGAETGAALLQ